MEGGTRLLDGLTSEEKKTVLKQATRRRFKRKEVIFHQGDPAETLHVLDGGWVAVRVVTALGDVTTLDLLGAGAIFGELAILPPAHRHRSASIVALVPTETLQIQAAVFKELYRVSQNALDAVLAMMAERERRLTERLVEALYLPVETRVVRRLIEVDREYGRKRPIPLTQDDLASLAGTKRETANRVLRRLVETGAVSVGHGFFQVVDTLALERLARQGRL